MATFDETGPEFERRGLVLARALHDPFGLQGAIMHKGRERDGLFIDRDSINAYEFTTWGTKDKAVKDGEKLAELVRDVGSEIENRFKSRVGWFVTRLEPTAEQRSAVQAISKRSGETVYAISVATLHQRICNSELYLQKRQNAPFGSIAYTPSSTPAPDVAISLQQSNGDRIGLRELTDSLLEGRRALIAGNFGAGKSHAMRELYVLLRKRHLSSGKLTPFPVHINLRDCVGLRTPAEILRRHAEEIGFDQPDGLISAWRAGTCVLLLDGFDEVIPSRWLGGAIDLKTVRWESLAPVRRLVEETPKGAAVVAAGRSHYFSTQSELVAALGFTTYQSFLVPDFDEIQLREFMVQAGVSWSVPDWVPMRPLLLSYLVSLGEADTTGITGAPDRASGWRRFFSAICLRETKMFSAVRPETIQEIVSRVASLARSRGDATGPIDMEQLRTAFVQVNGRQPDEEGIQLLLRLPGLAQASQSTDHEARVFADSDLADTAYGLELANYSLAPFGGTHPLASTPSWANAASDLAIEVAADALKEVDVNSAVVMAAISQRETDGQFDAVTADLVRVTADLPAPANGRKSMQAVIVSDVYFDRLTLVDSGVFAHLTLQDCAIETLDFSLIDETTNLPQFRGCHIGEAEGISQLPAAMLEFFSGCLIEQYSAPVQTTAGILALQLDRRSAIALTVLRKVFAQRGSGRKAGALVRGLPLADRALVDGVVAELVSQDWMYSTMAGNSVVYVGTKDRRRDAIAVLDHPANFKL